MCGHPHSYRQCEYFLFLKNRTSPFPYHSRHPHVAEEAGYLAAGIMLVDPDTGDVLLIREVRSASRISKYNFIGGKRECVRDWCSSPRLETSFETAMNEFEEETGQRLEGCQYDSVYWFPHSKFLLFVVKGNLTVSEVGEWISQEDLEQTPLHDYMYPQMNFILSSFQAIPMKSHVIV